MEQNLQPILDKAVKDDGPAGAVFGTIYKDKSSGDWKTTVVASGEQEIGSGKKTKIDNMFALYSCTKMLAGVAVMQAVEQGLLNLDDTQQVEKFAPELTAKEYLGGIKPRAKPTLRQLLTHTGGLCYSFFDVNGQKWTKLDGVDEFEGNMSAFSGPYVFEPGSSLAYGTGIDWAGIVLERASGKKLSEWLKEQVFDPLDAKTMTFHLENSDKDNLMSMHQRGKDGKLSVREHQKFTTQGATQDSGGAGAYGTAEDYLKCIVPLLNKGVGANGTRILSEETVAEMLRPQLVDILGSEKAVEDIIEKEIKAVNPELTNSIEMMPGVGKDWGLTFQILKDPLPTGRKSNSIWWAGLCNNYWAADPESQVATVILSASFPFNDPKVTMPWVELEGQVYKDVKA
ncbi:hypothetical protein OIO90_005223 [Microbotryomycetes sp. JL221]|nr:hypothetical protein OIO90_005223 [Microbotryomycetes sp. JL221]